MMNSEPGTDRTHWMFAYFAFIGSFVVVRVVYLPPLLADLGLSGAQLGGAFAVSQVVLLVFPFVWASIADVTNQRVVLFRLLVLGLVLAYSLFHVVDGVLGVSLGLVLMAMMLSGIQPLADSIVLARNPVRLLSTMKLGGAVGALVAVGGFSLVFADLPLEQRWVVRCTHLFVAGAAVFAWLVPRRLAVTVERPRGVLDSLALLRVKRFSGYLAIVVIYQASFAAYQIMFAIHVESLGWARQVAGYSFAAALVSEVVAMFVLSFTRFHPRSGRSSWLLLCILPLTALRWWLTGSAGSPALLVSVQALHGVSWACFAILSAGEIQALVAPHLRSTGMGLYAVATYGVGGALGSLTAGAALDRFGAASAFHVCAGLAALSIVPAVLYVASARRERVHAP